MTEMEDLKTEVRDLRTDLNERFVTRRENRIIQNEIRDLCTQILAKVKETNGRVTALERERIAESAVAEAMAVQASKKGRSRDWIRTSVITLLASGIGGVIGVVLH